MIFLNFAKVRFHLKIQEIKLDLSIAIDHVLSMKSVAASNAAGQANAVKSAPKTVSIAPCFISSIAIPNASQ